jgi:hypothetical protein
MKVGMAMDRISKGGPSPSPSNRYPQPVSTTRTQMMKNRNRPPIGFITGTVRGKRYVLFPTWARGSGADDIDQLVGDEDDPLDGLLMD